jgi:hypothetical protein
LSQQMQRYFAATLGFGLAAIWTAVSLSAAFTCLLVSCVGYVVAGVTQRRSLGRFLRKAKGERDQVRAIDENRAPARRSGKGASSEQDKRLPLGSRSNRPAALTRTSRRTAGRFPPQITAGSQHKKRVGGHQT